MWSWLVCLCLSVLLRLGQGFYWRTAWNESNVYPEPRSFASLSGLKDDSRVYLYGGFSHSRSEWLSETWKLQLGTAAPQWTKLGEGPWQHSALVTLEGVLLLIGGRNSIGIISDKLYRLNDTTGSWVPAKVKDDIVPPLYRHAAVSYMVGSSQRVLLCGGLNVSTNQTMDLVYELSYNISTNEYVFTRMSPMPVPLFGHSLAARGDSEVYVSGGLSGSLGTLPTAALPSRLARLMELRTACGGSPGPDTARASAWVFKFRRDISQTEEGSEGSWSVLGGSLRPTAFHASWFAGDVLYLYGGAQGPGEENIIASSGLQAVQILEGEDPSHSSSISYNLTAVQAALELWGEVQPGSVSGAAVWVNESATNSFQGRVWMFGGWATPQPLPSWADSYLSPQDSSLTWQLVGNSSEPNAAKWLAPLQGAMAPRGAAGLMSVPVTVGGSRKLLVMGGRTGMGWTGASPTGSALTYTRQTEFLPLPDLNDPLDSAGAYQLHDMWLFDQSTGKREMIWIVRPSIQPFGSWTNPVAVGRLWDRRLLEFQEARSERGGSATALYLQIEEVACLNCSGGAELQIGIWSLTLSVDGPFNATIATWRSLLPNVTSTNTATPSAACYPRVLYGAAHLVSMSSPNTSYLALHGGLVASSSSLWDTASDNVCVLELKSSGSRWLASPEFAKKPQARYRHACASRAGLNSYSMTCYGGMDNRNRRLLDDAWTLEIPAAAVIGPGLSTFVGQWYVALANYTAPRPGPRMDHWMLSVRGMGNTTTPSTSSSLSVPEANFSPVLLVGGSKVESSNMAISWPRQAIWLLDAAACADPDDSTGRSYKAQVWLPMQPDVELMGTASASWALAAAAIVKTESGLELWMLLAKGNKSSVGDVFVRKAVAPSSKGCLSTSLRPFCGNLSYDIKAAAMACWPNATLIQPNPSVRLNGDAKTLELQEVAGVLSLLDPDGAALPFGGVSFRMEQGSLSASLADVWQPSNVGFSELTVVAHGKPSLYLSSARAEDNYTLALPPSYKVSAKLQLSNGTVLSNITTELRIRGPDLLDRKRRSSPLGLPSNVGARSETQIGADTSITNSSGVAEFYVMNTTAIPPTSLGIESPSNVSYMVVFTLPSNTSRQYRIMLRSPSGAATNQGVSHIDDGVTSTLQGGPDAHYTIMVNVTSSNEVEVEFIITFKSPNGTAAPGFNGGWTAVVSPKFPWSPKAFSGIYNSSPSGSYRLMLSPELYVLEMNDNVTNSTLKPSRHEFDVRQPIGSDPLRFQVEVPMSYVMMNVSFGGIVANGRTGSTWGLHVIAQVYPRTHTNTFHGNSTLDESGNKGWTLLPGMDYLVQFYLANLLLHNYSFTTPPLDPNGSGQEISYNVTLPQRLLCGVEDVKTIDVHTKGRPSPNATKPIVYLSGVTCTWTMIMAHSVTDYEVYSSGLGKGSRLIVYLDNEEHDITNMTDYEHRTTAWNITITFNSDHDGLMDDFFVAWKIYPISSIPPQLIMVIAASSAAAGAMLLFLCLWHCVFRPVQMRRQQVANAMAAAASAATNTTGNVGGGRSANRNRVPRRYLRMMPTSTYLANDLAAAIAVAAPAPAAASGAPANPKDFAKLCNNDGTPNAVCAVDAVAGFLGQPGPGMPDTGTTSMRRERERSTSFFAVITQPAVSDVNTAEAAGTPAAVRVLPAQPLPSSSSGPASHSEPKASNEEVCSICLCEFEDGDRIKHLPCKHFYHVACIDQWLGRDITCPLCKDNVLEGLKSLFGPLPSRRTSAQRGPRGGEAETAAATSMTGTNPGTAETAPGIVPGAEDGGAGAAAGADLEMVLILPNETANQPAASATVCTRGEGVRVTSLPGSVSAGETEAEGQLATFGSPATNPPITGSAGMDAQTAGVAQVVVLRNAAGGAASGAGTVGPSASGTMSSSFSRELRPMRRNISADLTAEHDGSSSDCASSDDSELVSTLRQRHPGASPAAAPARRLPAGTATGNANARFFRIATPSVPSGGTAAAGGDFGGGGGGGGNQNNVNRAGNQFLFGLDHATQQPSAAASASSGTAVAASSFFETVGLAPSPRPVVEHVQRSSCSSGGSGTATRWMSNSFQVAPLPRPAAAAAGCPTVHRLARAQEAQMAVAAAALSAAAAVVSSGGINNGAGGSNVGVGGTNSWRTGSNPSDFANGAQSLVQGLDVSASAAAAALSYRVRNNPLALGSAASRSDSSSPRARDVASAGDLPSGSGSPAAPPSFSALRSAASVVAPLHAMSVLLGDQALRHGLCNGTCPRRPSSASSAGMPGPAVPDVSISAGDIVRLNTTTTATSHSQQHQPQGRATVTGPGGLAGV